MTKKALNQNSKYVQKLIDIIEPDFIFSEKPINRMKTANILKNDSVSQKSEKLDTLKKNINSIENCKIKINSKSIIIGDGNVFSSLMMIGETPGYEEDTSGLTYQGETGDLIKKMFLAIDIKLENIYNSSGRPPYGSYLPAQWHTVIQKAVAMSGTASLALRLR